jgi:hypothetical protein
MISTHPPASLQGALWSTDVNRLNLDTDKNLIIHHVLIYGTMEELKWLFTTYGKTAIAACFFNHPMKIYPRSVFSFVTRFLFPTPPHPLDEQDYVTSISGPVRQRTANRL